MNSILLPLFILLLLPFMTIGGWPKIKAKFKVPESIKRMGGIATEYKIVPWKDYVIQFVFGEVGKCMPAETFLYSVLSRFGQKCQNDQLNKKYS